MLRLKETSDLPKAGFSLDKIYFIEQFLRLVDLAPDSTESSEPISFGWDWRVIGAREFEVVLQVRVDPTRERPESASVVICGAFGVSGPEHTVATRDFVRAQGPAILFPYLREALTSLTSRSPHGPFILAPTNVLALMQAFDPEKATGALQLMSGALPAFLEN